MNDRSYRYRIVGTLYDDLTVLSRRTGIATLEIVRFGIRVALIALRAHTKGCRLAILTPSNQVLVAIPIPEDRNDRPICSSDTRESRPVPGVPA